MQNRHVPMAVIVAALVAVAVAGYAAGDPKPDVPPRVLFDNGGGRVVFDHATHAQDLGYECADCHHDVVDDARPLACGTCHPKEFGPKFAKEHQTAFPSDAYCARCHDGDPHAAGAELPDTDMIPLRSDAFHGQCMGCHQSEDAGPYGDDSCTSCHGK